MSSWGTVAKLVWLSVIGASASLAAAIGLLPSLRLSDLPTGTADWLVLAALSLLAVYLSLRPIQIAPDRRLTAASAPVIAIALLFDSLTVLVALALAGLAAHVVRRAPVHVAAFNVAQRVIAATFAGWTCAAAQAIPGVPFFVPCALAAAVFFLMNTAAVSAISAARKGTRWLSVWWSMAREQAIGEAALLTSGALVAVHVRAAPLAIPLFVPLLWLAWRVLVGAVEIRRLNASLRDTLDQQKTFVANASHELRTPIASLRAQLDALQTQVETAPRGEIAARVGDLARETTRIAALLSDLLAMARADSGQPIARVRVNLEDVLFDVYRELRPLAGAVQLNVRLDDDLADAPAVMGDQERLRQLVLNLGANALRFTPDGGSVEIRCGVDSTSVKIEVVDTGIGISADDQLRIFDRFYRVDRGRKRREQPGGSGLGLAIAKTIVEAHGGSIGVRSQPDRGSTFTVLLPAAAPDVVSAPRTEARALTAGAR